MSCFVSFKIVAPHLWGNFRALSCLSLQHMTLFHLVDSSSFGSQPGCLAGALTGGGLHMHGTDRMAEKGRQGNLHPWPLALCRRAFPLGNLTKQQNTEFRSTPCSAVPWNSQKRTPANITNPWIIPSLLQSTWFWQTFASKSVDGCVWRATEDRFLPLSPDPLGAVS